MARYFFDLDKYKKWADEIGLSYSLWALECAGREVINGKIKIKVGVCYHMDEAAIESWCRIEEDDHRIVIMSDGETTTAELHKGRELIACGAAVCSPDDTFDFLAGAQIAFDRLKESILKGDMVDSKPVKHYNGKVVCAGYMPYFTEGKVYEFVNGKVKDDHGDLRPYGYRITAINEYGEFIPFVE